MPSPTATTRRSTASYTYPGRLSHRAAQLPPEGGERGDNITGYVYQISAGIALEPSLTNAQDGYTTAPSPRVTGPGAGHACNRRRRRYTASAAAGRR